MDSLYRNMQQ